MFIKDWKKEVFTIPNLLSLFRLALIPIYVVIYLNIKIHDKDDTYFVFDITTETIVKLPDEVTELTDDAMEAGIAVAQEKTFEAVRAISVGMGINELDLGKQG